MDTLPIQLPYILKKPFQLSRSRSVAIRLRVNLNIVLAVVLGLIFIFIGLYLFQTGELIKGSYLIKTHRAEIEKLSSQNINLQGESVGLLSLGSVEEKVKELDFVKVEEVRYIPIADKTQLTRRED